MWAWPQNESDTFTENENQFLNGLRLTSFVLQHLLDTVEVEVVLWKKRKKKSFPLVVFNPY